MRKARKPETDAEWSDFISTTLQLQRRMAKLCLVVEVPLLVILVPALVFDSVHTHSPGPFLLALLLAAFCVREIWRDLQFLREYRRR